MPPFLAWSIRLRVIGVLVVVVAAIFTIRGAFAATFTARWLNPTTYTDDTALPAADITRNRIEYGSCGTGETFGTRAGEFISTGNDTSELSPNLTPGTYCHRVYTTAKGVESAASNVKTVVIAQPAPKPPTLLDALLAWIKSAWSRWFA